MYMLIFLDIPIVTCWANYVDQNYVDGRNMLPLLAHFTFCSSNCQIMVNMHVDLKKLQLIVQCSNKIVFFYHLVPILVFPKHRMIPDAWKKTLKLTNNKLNNCVDSSSLVCNCNIILSTYVIVIFQFKTQIFTFYILKKISRGVETKLCKL